MKKTIRSISLVFLTAIGTIGCNKYEVVQTPTSPVKNILNVVNTNPDFSLLSAALLRAGLQETFANGTLTLFAPTNEAFTNVGFPTKLSIDTAPVQTIANILRYHTVSTTVKSANVILDSTIVLSPLPPSPALAFVPKFYVIENANANNIFVNGMPVAQADIAATNGIVHKINTILISPSQNIVQLITNDPNYARLKEAIIKCNLSGALSAAGTLTVFAPNNAAFEALGYDASAIANANTATVTLLTNVLRLHVFNGSANLKNNGLLPTLFVGNSLTVNTNGASYTVKGAGNAQPANFTEVGFNKIASNGIIHFVDKVLLP